MRCLWLENGQLSLRDLPRPVAREGEALIRVELAGICATDLELVRGYLPFTGVPGHEFVGRVAVAPGAEEWVGRRVVGEINLPCGRCPTCAAGQPRHCPERSVLGILDRPGAFAPWLCLPLANLHRVPAGVSAEAAVFTEPLAAAVRVLEQVPITAATRVLVIGAGRLGQLIAQVLATTGCQLGVLARHPAQRSALLARGILALAEEALPRRWAEVVVEASGAPDGLRAALGALVPTGTLVLKTTHAGPSGPNLSPLVVDEITVIGSRCGPFPPALDLLSQGLVDPLPLIGARMPLGEGVSAFARAAQPGAGKVLLVPQAEAGAGDA